MCYWLVLFYAGVSLDMDLLVIQGKSYHTYIEKGTQTACYCQVSGKLHFSAR